MPMSEFEQHNISKLEVQVASLATSVTKMEKNLETFQSEVRGAIQELGVATGEQIAKVAEANAESIKLTNERLERHAIQTRMPVGQLISAGTLLLAVVAAVGTLAVSPIQTSTYRNEVRLESLNLSVMDLQLREASAETDIKNLLATQGRLLDENKDKATISESVERHTAQQQALSDLQERVRRLETRE